MLLTGGVQSNVFRDRRVRGSETMAFVFTVNDSAAQRQAKEFFESLSEVRGVTELDSGNENGRVFRYGESDEL